MSRVDDILKFNQDLEVNTIRKNTIDEFVRKIEGAIQPDDSSLSEITLAEIKYIAALMKGK